MSIKWIRKEAGWYLYPEKDPAWEIYQIEKNLWEVIDPNDNIIASGSTYREVKEKAAKFIAEYEAKEK